MKKIIALCTLLAALCVGACSKTCETEPIVEANHKLITPPNFGAQPK